MKRFTRKSSAFKSTRQQPLVGALSYLRTPGVIGLIIPSDSPVCRGGEMVRTIGVATMEETEIICDVSAYPKDLSFHWRFNVSSVEKHSQEDSDFLLSGEYDLVGLHVHTSSLL